MVKNVVTHIFVNICMEKCSVYVRKNISCYYQNTPPHSQRSWSSPRKCLILTSSAKFPTEVTSLGQRKQKNTVATKLLSFSFTYKKTPEFCPNYLLLRWLSLRNLPKPQGILSWNSPYANEELITYLSHCTSQVSDSHHQPSLSVI